MKKVVVAVLSVVLMAGLVGAASAAPILRFDNPTTDGGSLSYNGTGGPLVGTSIIFENVTCTGGCPQNDGVTLAIVGGLLNFTTGANTLEGGALYTWAGGGSFVLTGSIPGAGAAGTLLSGDFDDPVVGLINTQLLISGTGDDTKNPELLAFYGLTGYTFDFASTDIAAEFTRGSNGSLAGTVTESDVSNLGTPPASVPGVNPAALMGLGSVLFGTAGVLRLRARRP